VPIECRGGPLASGAPAAIAIRQHHVGISNGTAAPAGCNAVRGTVVRNVFLGSTRDYVVEAADGTQLRVAAAPEESFAPGTPVWLTFPTRWCRALVS
jgi:iron(III) transport system ATP-binding protein